jgi:glycosyltransferase involved in cell wall biosynthesis
MRVLILTQHFTPEITAARARLHPIAELLAKRGHDVEVLTAMPNHPEGIIADEFRGRLLARREMSGFGVRYLWVKTSPRKTFSTRLMFYGSYACMASLAGFASRRPDVVFASSPPLPVAAAAKAVARRHRVPWVMDVRDIWPEVAVVLGELRSGWMIGAAERLARNLYRSAAAIVTVTDAFRAEIAAETGEGAKITVIRNGTTPLWLEAGETETDRTGLGLPDDRFVWTYAGNVGIAQGLETAIDAAGLLGEDFQLRVIGAGPKLDEVRQRAERLPAGKVVFHGLMQPPDAARHLRASDANLVPLGSAPALEKFVPSKLFDCCAVGRPVVLAAQGESRELAAPAGAVYPVAPGKPEQLAEALLELRADARLRARLSQAGRAFATEHLRERQVERLEHVLSAVCERR